MGKVYYNNWLAKLILFEGYNTITLGPFIITKGNHLSDEAINEEMIHVRQWKDCVTLGLFVSFFISCFLHYPASAWWWLLLLLPLVFYYVMYGIEWLVSFLHHYFETGDKNAANANGKAYYSSAMEMEAKENRDNSRYLDSRPFGAFIKYYGKI